MQKVQNLQYWITHYNTYYIVSVGKKKKKKKKNNLSMERSENGDAEIFSNEKDGEDKSQNLTEPVGNDISTQCKFHWIHFICVYSLLFTRNI